MIYYIQRIKCLFGLHDWTRSKDATAKTNVTATVFVAAKSKNSGVKQMKEVKVKG
tara:strand:+ start:754 stop:918 length:165 start_codon:yes stop_codon:yes gene_type:complete